MAPDAAGGPLLPAMARLANKWRAETPGKPARVLSLPKGRWPLDLVREASGSGMLALRVKPGAGVEDYGLNDRDVIMIGLEDPHRGAPAFAAINNKVVIGWYKRLRNGRIAILPFIEGTAPVMAQAKEVQAIFALKAIAHESQVWSHEARKKTSSPTQSLNKQPSGRVARPRVKSNRH